MRILKATQGMHAALRIQMERKAVSLAGGRLPFLHSERLGMQVLNGTDTSIAFRDVLNTHEHRERAGLPSAEMERSLGML
jgi:Proteasome maturation factor UMP1